jgi:hypothetical protein
MLAGMDDALVDDLAPVDVARQVIEGAMAERAAILLGAAAQNAPLAADAALFKVFPQSRHAAKREVAGKDQLHRCSLGLVDHELAAFTS